ncbi:MAG: MgtC/SapB family protein [Ketobacteraceae bacterium]|nr:MgtC/SapB family protein [Ketobacteraceae bacterium]
MDSAITLPFDDMVSLAIALALGLLIGIQRGWVHRRREPGQRVAGIRTYTLVGLLGGVSAILGREFSELVIVIFLFALTLVISTAYYRSPDQIQDLSITGIVGTLLTFAFGVMAGTGMWALAASCAVITALILDNKHEIHNLLQKLQERELDAGLKLLLASVVMLSVLPNEGFGPWNAFNPYEIWWMVVLIASISFVGYFAVRIGGTSRGLLFTSLFAGLSSSTALTLHYAKLARDNKAISSLLGCGILVACGTMFPRMLLVCMLINHELAKLLFLPAVVMTVMTFIPAVWMWLTFKQPVDDSVELKQNPLELSAALFFAVLLLLIILLSNLLRDWFGSAGVYMLAMMSGIADVDAINLTLSRQAGGALSLQQAGFGIMIAAATNTIVKGLMAVGIGGRELTMRVLLPMSVAVAGGVVTIWVSAG